MAVYMETNFPSSAEEASVVAPSWTRFSNNPCSGGSWRQVATGIQWWVSITLSPWGGGSCRGEPADRLPGPRLTLGQLPKEEAESIFPIITMHFVAYGVRILTALCRKIFNLHRVRSTRRVLYCRGTGHPVNWASCPAQ